jgi:hypothetical protein
MIGVEVTDIKIFVNTEGMESVVLIAPMIIFIRKGQVAALPVNSIMGIVGA